MPRFSLEEPEFSTATTLDAHAAVAETPQVHSSHRCAASLACLSPDGRTMYSLVVGADDVFIEAHNLPLEGSTQEDIEREFPAIIRTKLPQSVAATLQVDAAVELFCAEGDSMPTPPRYHDSQRCLLPLLCLYTRHAVFLLHLGFACPFQDKVVTGEVISVTEPLESHVVSESVSIVRVRPAPQRRMGYATMCPPGSLAMLTHHVLVNEYSLVLYHGPHEGRPKGWISVPLRFGFEQLDDNTENNITDFSFAQSNGLPLLATMSVHFLKASGDVLGATPILFDGSVVPWDIVRESKDYLVSMTENEDSAPARAGQCHAALQYFHDAFGPEDRDAGAFVTARTSAGSVVESSLFWPVQIQGPVVVSSLEPGEAWHQALVIEPFFAQDVVGMAIGRERIGVDFCAIPATCLLPRFTYMDERDQAEVDSLLVDLGVLVERITVDAGNDDDDQSGNEGGFTTLVRDPIVDKMIHYASAQGVVSIRTNAMKVYSNNLRTEALAFMSPGQKDETVRSMAWSSLDVSPGMSRVSLAGAVVSGDALLGHTLIVSLSDGTPAAINLTESRYLHDAETIFQAEGQEKNEKNQIAVGALKSMEETPPLYELLGPLLQQANKGLAGMSMIVGEETAQKDIQPSTLATVLSVKERCEKEVVVPLQEIDRIATSRLKELKEMYKLQQQQMAALKDTVELLKERMKTSCQEMEVAESNSALLAQRSGALLQATSDLRPTVTAAESEFFDLLRRVKAKCDRWEEAIGGVQAESTKLCNAVAAGRATAAVDLEATDIEQCFSMLHGQEEILSSSKKSLDETKRTVNSIVSATGLGAGDENVPPPGDSEQ